VATSITPAHRCTPALPILNTRKPTRPRKTTAHQLGDPLLRQLLQQPIHDVPFGRPGPRQLQPLRARQAQQRLVAHAGQLLVQLGEVGALGRAAAGGAGRGRARAVAAAAGGGAAGAREEGRARARGGGEPVCEGLGGRGVGDAAVTLKRTSGLRCCLAPAVGARPGACGSYCTAVITRARSRPIPRDGTHPQQLFEDAVELC